MTNNNLKQIVHELKANTNREDAYLKLDGDITDNQVTEGHFKANKEGLLLMAAELLTAAAQINELESKKEYEYWLDNSCYEWMDLNDGFFYCVSAIIHRKRKSNECPNHEPY